MKVICGSIGTVPSYSNVIGTECSMCGAAKPHDDGHCQDDPCPWNKNAKCIPARVQQDSVITDKDLRDIDDAKAGMSISSRAIARCQLCGRPLSEKEEKADICTVCFFR